MKTITDGIDNAKLRSLVTGLYRFNQFDPKMQVSTILVLLEIAAAEARGDEITVQDLEQRIGLKSGTASRNVYYWEAGHPDMRGGHGMVSVRIHPIDRRKRLLAMTTKGKAFLKQLAGGELHGATTG